MKFYNVKEEDIKKYLKKIPLDFLLNFLKDMLVNIDYEQPHLNDVFVLLERKITEVYEK